MFLLIFCNPFKVSRKFAVISSEHLHSNARFTGVDDQLYNNSRIFLHFFDTRDDLGKYLDITKLTIIQFETFISAMAREI